MQRVLTRTYMVAVAGLVLLLAASVTAFGEASDASREIPLLVETKWLAENLDRPDIRIVDVGRLYLDYRGAHIPGAVYVDRELIYREVNGIPGMMPDPHQVAAALEDAGIGSDHAVVIYDDANALWSTRLFWTLEYLGHTDVHVVHGGWAKWTHEEQETINGVSDAPPVQLKVDVREELLATKAWVLENYNQEDVRVVDTRSRAEYRGNDARARRGGHIPGAVHANWVLNVDDPSKGTFLPKDELRELYDTLGVTENVQAVTHCQTGIRGAHTYFSLRLLGYENVRLYDGSWVEWGNAEDTPVVSGDN